MNNSNIVDQEQEKEQEGKKVEEETQRVNKWSNHEVNYDALYENQVNFDEDHEKLEESQIEIKTDQEQEECQEEKEMEEEPPKVKKWAHYEVNYDALYDTQDNFGNELEEVTKSYTE